jgi:hypothetical protein
MDDERDRETPSSIAHQKRAILTERALLALIVFSLAATFNLMLAIHRHTAPIARPPDPSVAIAAEPSAPAWSQAVNQSSTAIDSGPQTATASRPSEPAVVSPPPEDPTKKALAGLATATAQETEAGEQADRRAAALEVATQAATAESRRWQRRELLVRQQIAGLAARADDLENAASVLDAERDVLAHERDALKAALSKAGRRSGFAVLPYKGPNGTWRRPIVLECKSGAVKLQPKGPTFSSLELSPLINPRSSPLVRAIAQEMLHIQASDTPDGAAAVPYLVFLVRPHGIRPYYEARTCLEPLGIAFGYELIEQDLEVEIPDFDNLASWDGSVPLDMPLEPAPRSKASVAMNSPSDRGALATGSWPERSGRGAHQPGTELGDGDGAKPEDFVWPSRPRQSGRGNGSNSGPEGSAPNGLASGSDGTELSGPGGAGQPGIAGGGGSFRSFSNQSAPSGGTGGNGALRSPESARYPGIGTGTGLTSAGGRGSGLPAGGGTGSDLTPGGGTGSGLLAGGGTGSGLLTGGTGSGLTPGGGTASNPVANGGAGADLSPSAGSGPNMTPGSGSGSRVTGGGGSGNGMSPGDSSSSNLPPLGDVGLNLTPRNNAGSTPTPAPGAVSGTRSGATGGGEPAATGQLPGSPGTDSVSTTNGGGGSPLPDLEPASDGGATRPLPTGTISPANRPTSTGSAAGPAGGGPGQAGFGTSAPGGPGSATSGPIGGGPGQGSGSPPAGQDAMPATAIAGTGSPGGVGAASDKTGGAAAIGGFAGTNPGSGSAAGDSTSQPSGGQQRGSAEAAQGSSGSNGSPNDTPSAGASGQPSIGMYLPGGLTSPPSSPSSSGFGAPSSSTSTSQNSSNDSMGGMPLDTLSTTGSSSSSASSSFGQPASAAKDSSSSDDLIFAPAPRQASRPGSIEVPFEIVVVCRQNDILLHPGGYRLSAQAMRQQAANKDCLLAREIVAMVRKRAIVDPMIRPKPKIKFLVETNGSSTFWTARRQLLFSLPDWPMSLQVPGTQDLHVFTKETW